MEWPARTSNTLMIYKIINALPTFWVIVQVQNVAECVRRLVFETLWIFTQLAVVTCSGSSCRTWARPAQLAQWPLPLYRSHTAQCPRWGTSVPGSCRHNSYAQQAGPVPYILDARLPWYIRFASLASNRRPCYVDSWANHDTNAGNSRTPVGCLKNINQIQQFASVGRGGIYKFI
jgi:hypothetical protein